VEEKVTKEEEHDVEKKVIELRKEICSLWSEGLHIRLRHTVEAVADLLPEDFDEYCFTKPTPEMARALLEMFHAALAIVS